MSEGTESSVPASENATPESVSPPSGRGGKLWMKIVAIIVVVALIATALIVMLPSEKKLTATILGGTSLRVDAGTTNQFTVVVKLGKTDVTNDTLNTTIRWSVLPALIGELSLKAKPTVPFVAGLEAGNGTLSCVVTLASGKTVTVSKPLEVLPPFLDSVSVTPSSKTIVPGGNYTFKANAVSSVGLAIPGLEFSWSVDADAGVTQTLNATTGQSVLLEVGTGQGYLNLSATATYGGATKTGNSSVRVGPMPPRSMDYRWYDLFNVPIGSWYDKRWEIYHQEERISNSYPWLFYYHDSPEGNTYTYSLMRLNMTGRNISGVNMNDKPEFLPILSPTERGGTAVIDWYMQYLTYDELSTNYGVGIANQDDGWIIDLNGTVILDKQAAKTVLNLTDTGWDTFSTWWESHSSAFSGAYQDWLVSEAEGRVDIENAYESYYQLFVLKIDATKVGETIVLKYDILTWGMEALMLRWLHECFLPIEMWYEDMNFHMTIMPEWSTVDIDTAVTYAAYASDSLDRGTNPIGDPVWVFMPLLGDAQPSSLQHPISLFDKYAPEKYINREAGSDLFNTYMDFDNVPAAWNLTENETLTFEWPAGEQIFRYHVRPGLAVNVTDLMNVTYTEPMDTDFPGQVEVNYTERTLAFTGPIPMWDWSKNQTAHAYLQSEWSRLGMLPYGIPRVEFKKNTPVIRYLDGFRIDMSPSVPAKDWATFTVTALDNYGNVFEGYQGTVNFTSDDSAAVMPDNYTFNLVDSGVHTFTGAVQFGTEGSKTLTVLNVSLDLPLITGSKSVNILPIRTADSMEVEVYYIPAVSVPEDVTVTVIDQYGDVFLNYTGTATFSTNRTGDVTLPADYPFVLADEGVHTIAGGLTFAVSNVFTITASDLANSSITGSASGIWVAPNPEVIDHFAVSGIKNMLQNQKSGVDVTAYDQYNMVFKRYQGTITFSANSSIGALGALPADYTFLVSDEGVKKFSKEAAGEFVKFDVKADTVFTVTVTDTVTTSATGSQSNILIQYKPPSQTFRMYDLFQQPWGEWFPWRYPAYKTDIILTNETGKYTMIYNPDKRGTQGIIYAPYRWNITGTNLSQMSVHSPEFMPVLGTPNVDGALADVQIYFQYLDHAWWNSYWSPVWHYPDSVMTAQEGDGYYPGTVYKVSMNRAAALEWLGMPQTADPASWWYANGANYTQAWQDWIMYEGNTRLDIWNGYEYPYVNLGTKMKLSSTDGGNTIVLEIGHLGEGYEILTTRWLTDTGLCNHEPYYEDMSINLKYYSQWSDLQFDAVCQYSLHAVKANQSATNEGAWAWEPQLIDYVPSGNGHPSTFDRWSTSTYQSWNAGDPVFGQQAAYDSGLQYFNLTDYQKFIIELPKGSNNLGFYGQAPVPPPVGRPIVNIVVPPAGSGYDRYPRGDGSNYDYESYWPLMYNGTVSLGWYGNWTGAPYLDTMYDPVANTVTMVGPMNFDNTHLANGALYRGAPWIEFNVTPVVGGTSLPAPSNEASVAGTSAIGELVSLAAIVAGTAMAIVALAVGARRRTE